MERKLMGLGNTTINFKNSAIYNTIIRDLESMDMIIPFCKVGSWSEQKCAYYSESDHKYHVMWYKWTLISKDNHNGTEDWSTNGMDTTVDIEIISNEIANDEYDIDCAKDLIKKLNETISEQRVWRIKMGYAA